MNYQMMSPQRNSNHRNRKQNFVIAISIIIACFMGFMAGKIIEASSHQVAKNKLHKQIYELEQELSEYRTELRHYRGEYNPNDINNKNWSEILSD